MSQRLGASVTFLNESTRHVKENDAAYRHFQGTAYFILQQRYTAQKQRWIHSGSIEFEGMRDNDHPHFVNK